MPGFAISAITADPPSASRGAPARAAGGTRRPYPAAAPPC